MSAKCQTYFGVVEGLLRVALVFLGWFGVI